MAGSPDIAVIIGAYRREPYLLRAVRSVLDQTLPRERYEILVTKNFHHDAIDGTLAELGVASRFDDDPVIGPWLLRAVEATHAPRIAFLDDDDEFEPDRLERVLAVFADHPEVGFYRNRVRVIDGSGAPVPPDRWRTHEVDASFDATGPVLVAAGEKDRTLPLARETHVTFNSSTMVVRRELLEGPSRAAFEGTQLPDLALFLAGTISPYSLYLDDRRLTRFRFYGENVTHRVRWLGHAAESHARFASVARAFRRDDLAAWFDHESVHFERLYLGGRIVEAIDSGADRRRVTRLTAEYLRFLARHPGERAATLDVWGAVAYGLLHLASPSLARRAHAARRPAGTG